MKTATKKSKKTDPDDEDTRELKDALEEITLVNAGKLTMRTYKVPIPPKEISLKEFRKAHKISQPVLASILNHSVKTVVAWEVKTRTYRHLSS